MDECRVRVKAGWGEAGREGRYLATVFAEQEWCVVVWDGDDDPNCFKAGGLEFYTRPTKEG